MRLVRRAPLWLAAVLALTAICDVAAFMLGDKASCDHLLNATLASMLGTASLFAGVCLVSFEARDEFERAGGRVVRRVAGELAKRSTNVGRSS
jgi:hypothetical protein